MLAVLVLAAFAWSRAAVLADVEIDLPLAIARGENCWFDGQSARLLERVWAPDEQGRIGI
jgi:hypothetical protein